MIENVLIYGVVMVLVLGGIVYLLIRRVKKNKISRTSAISPKNFYEKVQKGYITLFYLLYHNSNKKDLLNKINYIFRERTDGRYVGGYTKNTNEFDSLSFVVDYFYDILNHTGEKNESFILSVERKSSVIELDNQLKVALGRAFNQITLPTFGTVVSVELLEAYQKALNKQGIQLGFLDDNSDTYYILLHAMDKEDKVQDAISKIGFSYTKTVN